MRIPPVTLTLLIAIVVVFVAQQVLPRESLAIFELWSWGDGVFSSEHGPLTLGFRPWQLITYGFMHLGIVHLLFNGWTLYQFGSAVEQRLGSPRYLLFYFVCLIGAGICQVLTDTWVLDPANPVPVSGVGASGAIFGLLFAFAAYYPRAKMIFFLLPIPVPAWLGVMVYGAIELYLGISGKQPGVGHFAHLGGLLFGAVLVFVWRGQSPPPAPLPPDNPYSAN